MFLFLIIRARNNWSWVPVIGCFVGGVVGAVVYILTIEIHHVIEENTDDVEMDRVITNTSASNQGYEAGKKEDINDSCHSTNPGSSSTTDNKSNADANGGTKL